MDPLLPVIAIVPRYFFLFLHFSCSEKRNDTTPSSIHCSSDIKAEVIFTLYKLISGLFECGLLRVATQRRNPLKDQVMSFHIPSQPKASIFPTFVHKLLV
ncbi:hypothetical protein ILYODFUR_009229 [Ilyodon furcidens]|uniref:Uncharacterized protein n=1 Tax=Ilyodon furcidens TaxID=33524 RepID=A0ABV0TH79_9TELE